MLALVVKPAQKPVPTVAPALAIPDRAGYADTCKKLGFVAPTLTEEAVLSFMHAKGIPLYDLTRVNRYMDRIAWESRKPWAWHKLRATDAIPTDRPDGHKPIDGRNLSPERIAGAAIVGTIALTLAMAAWILLQCSEPQTAIANLFGCSAIVCVVLTVVAGVYHSSSPGYCGHTDHGLAIYARPVPHDHLRNALLLSEAFPELSFFVADYEVVVPDPFIMCTTHTGWRIVFGMWDEPGFGS